MWKQYEIWKRTSDIKQLKKGKVNNKCFISFRQTDRLMDRQQTDGHSNRSKWNIHRLEYVKDKTQKACQYNRTRQIMRQSKRNYQWFVSLCHHYFICCYLFVGRGSLNTNIVKTLHISSPHSGLSTSPLDYSSSQVCI